MFPDRWNRGVALYPTDHVFKAVFEPLFPRWVRPNHLTLFRLFLTLPVLYFLSEDRFDIGVPLFLLAALTDWFDGALARCRRQVSEWGVVYDPVVDKILIGSVLFVIVLHHINYYLGMALLAVEVFLVVAGWIRKTHGVIEPANKWGKIKMVAEVSGVTLLLLALWLDVNLLIDLSTGTLALALVFALVSVYSHIR